MTELRKLSIVIPVYNGAKTIPSLVDSIENELSHLYNLELILVNDGSPNDNSAEVCADIALKRSWVVFVNLAKNFGEHHAVMAGLNQCQGDCAVIMDDDFQNPPYEVKKLIDELDKGVDVVFSSYAKKKHCFVRNLGSKFNNLIATLLIGKPFELYLSSFKVINRFLINELIKYDGPSPYIDGLILRATDSYRTIEVEHRVRSGGQSGYTLHKLLTLYFNMVTNFSILPLRLATILGLIIALICVLSAVVFTIEKIRNPFLPIGWASLIISGLLMSSVQLFALGTLGEYLGRLFLTINHTPQFTIREIIRGGKKVKV